MSNLLKVSVQHIEIWEHLNQHNLRNAPNSAESILVKMGLIKIKNIMLGKVSDTTKNRRACFKLWESASIAGSGLGLYLMGLCMQHGFGCKKQPKSGLSAISWSARLFKCPVAEWYLALYWLTTKPNIAYKLAIRAAQNIPYAQKILDTIGLHSQSAVADVESGILKLRRAAEQGDVLIQGDLNIISEGINKCLRNKQHPYVKNEVIYSAKQQKSDLNTEVSRQELQQAITSEVGTTLHLVM